MTQRFHALGFACRRRNRLHASWSGGDIKVHEAALLHVAVWIREEHSGTSNARRWSAHRKVFLCNEGECWVLVTAKGKTVCFQPFICCPDNAVPIPVTQPPVAIKPAAAALPDLPSRINLDEIRNHPNFNLINLKCGQSSTDRITNGYKAKPGDLPWM